MKQIILMLFFAGSLVFTSCDNSGQKTESPDEQSKGSGIDDEVGGPDRGAGADAPGEEGTEMGGIGTGVEDSLSDTTSNQ